MLHTIATICILSLLSASYALGSQLSPSFSYQGTAVTTVTSGASATTTTYTHVHVAIDVARGLVFVEGVGLRGGVEITETLLGSYEDNLLYYVINDVCSEISYITYIYSTR